MSDLFVSYSRKDGGFAWPLVEELGRRELDVWIDQRDIPPTAEWLAEIATAIENADAILVILSEAWLASEICAIELDRAVTLGKRIIPLAHGDVDPTLVPDALRRLQWVRPDPAAEPGAAAERVITAFGTDPEHLRTHTRLLRRALDWERRGTDASRLLRGADLAEADAWCRQATSEPPPTALHRRFVDASRGSARRRRRLALAGAGLLGVVAVVAGLVYLQERSLSAERDRIALSREIAGQAIAAVPLEQALPLLLAIEAHRVHPTLESLDALHKALVARPKLAVRLPAEDGLATGLQFTADSQRLAVGRRDGRLTVWDIAERTQRTSGDVAPIEIETMALSPDLEWAVASGSGDMAVLRFGEGALSVDAARFANVLGIAHAPGGDRYATANGLRGAGVSLWNAETHVEEARFATPGGFGVDAVAYSPDGSTLAAAGWDNRIALFDVASGALSRVIETGADVLIDALAFSPDGRWLAYPVGGYVDIYDLDDPDGGPPASLAVPGASVRALAFGPEGRWLAVGTDQGRVWLLDHSARWRTEIHQDLGTYVTNLAFSPDGQWLAAGGYGDHVALYDLARIGQTGAVHLDHGAPVSALALSSDGGSGASGSWDGLVRVWSGKTRDEGDTLRGHGSPVFGLAFDPEGRTLLSMGSPEGLRIYDPPEVISWNLDATPPEPISPLPQGAGGGGLLSLLQGMQGPGAASGRPSWQAPQVLPAAIAPSRLAYAQLARFAGPGRTNLMTRSLETAESPIAIPDAPDGVDALALSRDGTRLATVDDAGRIRIRDTRDWSVLSDFDAGRRCASVGFSASGAHLVAACGDVVLLAGRPFAEAEPRRFTIDQGGAARAIVAPEGDRMVVVDPAGSIRLWDIATGRSFGAAFGNGLPVGAAEFGPDGEVLYTGHFNGWVVAWRLDVASWIARACDLARRDLSEDEWRRFVGGGPPRSTCRTEE